MWNLHADKKKKDPFGSQSESVEERKGSMLAFDLSPFIYLPVAAWRREPHPESTYCCSKTLYY